MNEYEEELDQLIFDTAFELTTSKHHAVDDPLTEVFAVKTEKLKSFIRSQKQKDRDNLVEMVRGMKVYVPDPIEVNGERDLNYSQERNQKKGYNKALADLEQAINKIMK